MSFSINTYTNNYALPAKNNRNIPVQLKKFDNVSFKSKGESTNPTEYKNPINKAGEYALAISKSFYSALGTSSRVCFELGMSSSDDGFDLPTLATIGVLATVVTFAVQLPKAIYQANVDFFTKKKEMDVYSRDSSFRSTVYEKLDKKSEEADPQELKKLSKQALKLKMAENKMPDCIKNSQNFAARAFLKGFYMRADN